jgi:DNA gyrase subunit A
MWREGLKASHRYSKCAGVVGEVLKKYHPHGDMAVYDTLVRMAQPWNMRYLLVDGQGNFGSVDGDNAAAYRYTECKMTRVAEQLLTDIDKETVNFTPNFDGSTEEPEVLPAAFPNLLVNGAEGIAVGMATKIPPHNLKEVINGVLALIENPQLDIAGLLRHIPGPDFPTAGTIYGSSGIYDAYSTGRGKITVRGHVSFEESDGRDVIVVTELPFQTNKARFQEEIVELVKEKKLDGIHAIRDESAREGMRVVIELKRDAVPEVVVNNLYKYTQLQSTFGIILLAIVNQRPRVLDLKEVLQLYIGHRREITLRRCRFELRKALERAHLLEGLRIALDHIDRVIEIIRSSKTTDEARARLVQNFALSEIQAQAILDMRLQRLTGLERDKLEEEYKEVMARVEYLKGVLQSEAKLMEVITAELVAVRDLFGDDRRTRIVADQRNLTVHDLVAEEDQVLTLSHLNYIKRTSLTEYRMQKRGGMGKMGMAARDGDYIQDIFIANTHASLLCFTNQGRVYRLSVLDVPEANPSARGKPLINLIQLDTDEKIASVVPVRDLKGEGDLVFCTRKGMIKRTGLSAYANVRAGGLEACDILEGDELLKVCLAPRKAELILNTAQGRCVRFDGSKVRAVGRIARGVRGVNLKEGDEVVSLVVVPPEEEAFLLTATEAGYGKRTPLSEYPKKGRGTQGVIDIQTGERNGVVVGCEVVFEADQIMLITDTGRLIRTGVKNVPIVARRTKGVRLMRLEEKERIVGMTRLEAEEGEENEGLDESLDEGLDESLDESLDEGLDEGLDESLDESEGGEE